MKNKKEAGRLGAYCTVGFNEEMRTVHASDSETNRKRGAIRAVLSSLRSRERPSISRHWKMSFQPCMRERRHLCDHAVAIFEAVIAY